MSAEPRNLLQEWSRLLVGSLSAAGVRDVVVSPGSRSTPLVLAVAEAAAGGALRCHPVIDERAAGFHALGMAKATGRPSLLLCTSGSAGAHYLPAVIEAGYSHTPLLVLTADRPFELQGCAAPQTIDQVKLFGDHARAFFECGMPDPSDGALRALRRMAAQAVATSLGPLPGAVHLNARARKPLEPPLEDQLGTAEQELAARARAVAAAGVPRQFAPRLLPDERAIDELAAACAASTRGVIIAGPAPLSQAKAQHDLFALVQATGFPLLAEAASQLRFTPSRHATGIVACDHYDAFLAVPAFRDAAAPDLVIQLGAPPTSSAIEGWLAAHPDCPRWVIAPHGWNDPSSRATALIRAGVAETALALTRRIGVGDDRAARLDRWRTRFSTADTIAEHEIASVLSDDRGEARATFRAIPLAIEGCAPYLAAASEAPVLALGNSLPIRMVDFFCPRSGRLFDVWSQRGANGIDGLIAGAAGVARAGRPTLLVLGDVSAVHDLGGLCAARDLPVPLVVVVMNNGGGRIFEQLPVAGRADLAEHLDLFLTPHNVSFVAAARLHGHRYLAADADTGLARALELAWGNAGCTIIEVALPPSSALEATRKVHALVERALEARPDLTARAQ